MSDFLSIYKDLSVELFEKKPELNAEIATLIGEVKDPLSNDADDIWPTLWTKPLFANTRVQTANQWIDRLEKLNSMPKSWFIWGQSKQSFLIERTGKGISRSSFQIHGLLAEKTAEKSKIALHRLFAIQGGAMALRSRNEAREFPFSDLANDSLDNNIRKLKNEFGFGWGHVTILHFLTDLGLAVKPDLHLVNTLIALGYSGRNDKVPNVKEALKMNAFVRDLLVEDEFQFTPAGLRKMDKILMEISRQGLLKA